MTNQTTHTTTTATADYNNYFYNAVKSLKSINSRCYSPMLESLISNQWQDLKALKTPFLTEQSQAKQTDIDELTAEINETTKAIKRLTTSQADRDELDEILTDLLTDRATARAERDTLSESRHNSINFSDLFDSVQEYALATLEEPTAKDYTKATERHNDIIKSRADSHTANIDPYILPQFNASLSAVFFYDNIEELQAEHINELAQYYHSKSAVTKYIHSSRAPQTLDSTKTTYRTATAEQIEKWTAQGHPISADFYIQLDNQNRISLMYKDGVLQFRTQYKTIKNGISLENYKTENGEYLTDGYIKTYNMYADKLGALEQLETLCNTRALTERERLFISAFCSRPALTIQNKAHIFYHIKYYDRAVEHSDFKQFNKHISSFSYGVRLKYACKRIGITETRRQTEFIKRMLTKLKKSKDQTDKIKLIKTDFEYYDYLMTTNRGTAQATADKTADLLLWIEQSHTAKTTDKVIQWIKSDRTTHTVTAEERRADEQTERDRQATAIIYSARLETFKALRDANQWNSNGTYNAKFSAFTFFNSLTEGEQLKSAELRLYEQSQAKAKAEQMKQHKTPSVDEWHKMSRADKDKYITEFNKRYK